MKGNKKKIFLLSALVILLMIGITWKNIGVNVSGDDIPKKKIALTFDDGPSKYTEKLLDGLRERNVKATFFLLGVNAESRKDVIEQMHEDGHIIGNHTYNHIQLTKVIDEKACEDVEKLNDLIFNITGEKVEYIRPPYGSWNSRLTCLEGLTVVLWNVDTLDWSIHSKNKIARHIVKNAEDGSIVLLHDIYESSVDAALMAIDELQEQGYEFVTVDELGQTSPIQ